MMDFKRFLRSLVSSLGPDDGRRLRETIQMIQRCRRRLRGRAGSAQDFVVNVGDRCSFETDSTELTRISPPSRQAGAVLNQYRRYAFTIEVTPTSAERANTHRTWRSSLVTRDYLIARGLDGSRFHDFLRQGTAGRGSATNFWLVGRIAVRSRVERRQYLIGLLPVSRRRDLAQLVALEAPFWTHSPPYVKSRDARSRRGKRIACFLARMKT